MRFTDGMVASPRMGQLSDPDFSELPVIDVVLMARKANRRWARASRLRCPGRRRLRMRSSMPPACGSRSAVHARCVRAAPQAFGNNGEGINI